MKVKIGRLIVRLLLPMKEAPLKMSNEDLLVLEREFWKKKDLNAEYKNAFVLLRRARQYDAVLRSIISYRGILEVNLEFNDILKYNGFIRYIDYRERNDN